MNVYGNVDVACVVFVVDAGDDVTRYDAAPFTGTNETSIVVLVAPLTVGVPAGESVWTVFVVTVELIPAELTAVIVKVYEFPGVRPVNVVDVPLIAVCVVPPVPVHVTLYVDAPPVGAFQLTVIWACAMAVNTPPMSVPERVTGFGKVNRAADAIDVPPFPLALIDRTVNVYDVFGLRPVKMYGYVADVCGDVATAGVDVNMLLVAPWANDASAI